MPNQPPEPSDRVDATSGPLTDLDALSARWGARSDELTVRYEMLSLLGRGGMGAVYLVFDRRLRRPVAAKVIPLREAGDVGVARFLSEAQLSAQLAHPNIPPIHDVGLANNNGYFVMRALSGRTLSAWIKEEGRPPIARALEVFSKVCDAVAYAHGKGVLHRDLKPGNILLGSYGEVYVIDWGLAQRTGRGEGLETDADELGKPLDRAGSVVGTPTFMAPEQAKGEPVDERSDIYALGAVLYTLLTGKRPFPGNASEALPLVRRGEYTPPRKHRPDLPWELDRVVRRAMALEPERRHQTVAALRADLDAWREGAMVPSIRYGPAGRLKNALRRHRRAVAGGVLGTATLAAAGLVTLGIYVVTLTAARDRAVEAERLAEHRALSQQIALAQLGAETGHAVAARGSLVEAVARAHALLFDPRPAEFALSALDNALPPPDIRVKAPGATWVVDASGTRLGVLQERRVAVHELISGSLLSSWEAPGAGEVTLLPFEGEAIGVMVQDGARLVRYDGRTGVRSWEMPIPASFSGGKAHLAALGTHVAVATDTTIQVLQVPTGAPVGPVFNASFSLLSFDGSRLLTHQRAGPHRQSNTREVYEVANGRLLHTFVWKDYALFDPNLDRAVWSAGVGVVVVGADGQAVWHGDAPDPLIGLGPDAREVGSYGTDGTIEVRDLWTGELRSRRRAGDGRTMAEGVLIPTAGWVASMLGDEIHLWSRAEPPGFVRAHDSELLACTASLDGHLIATAAWAGDVAVWDRLSRRELARFDVCDSGVRDVAFSADARRLATADRCGNVEVFDLTTGARAARLEAHSGVVTGVRWIDGDRLASVHEDGRVIEWDTRAQQALRVLHRDLTAGWGLASGGGRLAVAGRSDEDPVGELWDVAEGERVAVAPTRALAFGAAISADGTRWAVGGQGGRIYLEDQRGERMVTLTSDGPVLSVALSGDGSLLAAGVQGGRVVVLETEGLTPLLDTAGAGSMVSRVEFLADTHTILFGAIEPSGWTTIDLDRSEALKDTALTYEAGQPVVSDWVSAASRFETAGDWTHLLAALDKVEAAGTPVPALRRARAAAGADDPEAARAALARPDSSVLDGTLALWRRSFGVLTAPEITRR